MKLNGRKRQKTGRIPGSRLSSKAILYTTQGIKTELLIALDSAHRGLTSAPWYPTIGPQVTGTHRKYQQMKYQLTL